MDIAQSSSPTCATCQSALDVNGVCRHCQDAANWKDQIEAVDFVMRRCGDWHSKQMLSDRQFEKLAAWYASRREVMTAAAAGGLPFRRDATFPPDQQCWSCRAVLGPYDLHCGECGVPVSEPGVRSLRYWRYLYGELKDLDESGRLNLRQAHEFLSDTKERIAALRRKLEHGRIGLEAADTASRDVRQSVRDMYQGQGASASPSDAAPMAAFAPVSHESIALAVPRRNLLEILADPQSIQWLLGAGGCLIFFGLVIWLISLGVFNNPVRVAVLLGVGNAVLVGGGWALMLRTRYQNVGRALTLLACLIMPLNLWFYHANNLVVYQGYLWLPALVCCAVYAASAYVLKDAMFVYTFVGGIALTGLLVLAQQNHFGEVFAPVTLLMILGLLCLHAERAFPDNDSPFSRKKFGLAFFWSAHALIGTGLVLLLYAQFIGLLYNPIFKGLGISQPAVVRHDYLPWTTLLVLAGTYAYVYSDMVVRRVGVYLCLAAVTLLWAEMQLLAWTTPSAAIVIVTLSLTALAVNILQRALVSQHELLRIVPPLGILLSLMPVAYGVLLHFWATSGFAAFKITWDFAGAMAVTAVCCRAGAYLYRHADEKLSMTYFFATAAATLVFAASIASLITLERWVEQAPILMLIPIIYLVASHLYRGHTPEVPLERVAHAATIVMLAYGIKSSLRITVLSIFAVESSTDNLLLALFCLETAAFYALVSYLRRAEWSVYLATGMLCGAIWQLAKFARTPDEIYILFFALAGFGLLLAFRFGIVERWNIAGLEKAVFRCANALTVLGFASGVLLSLGRLLSETDFRADHWRVPFVSLLVLLACLSTISVLSAWIVQQQEWRRTYCVVSVINAVLVVLTIHRLMALDPWQTLEVLAILFGAAMLGAGHWGWYRETERNTDLVSVALVLGSLSFLMPLLLASAIHRFGRGISPWDEFGLIFGCVALFGSGVLCRIKATTIFGAAVMICYLLIVLVDLGRNLNHTYLVGIYLTLGGVILFGTGLALSVYRDRLLALPDQVKRRQGIFRIIDWR